MDEIKKDAGQAGERPRPSTSRRTTDAAGEQPKRQAVGRAPGFDAEAREMVPRGSAPGMKANPWVQQYVNAEDRYPVPDAAEEPTSSARVDAGSAPDQKDRET